MNEEINITGNIKLIDWLKTELLGSVTSLYRILLKGSKASRDIICESIAEIVILSYLLARRLGIDFSSIDSKIQNKLKIGIIEEDRIETNTGDLSELLEYIRERKDRT